jgi:hypothetical protein
MLIAVWKRWVDSRQWWWLALLGGVLIVDALIGSWLIAQEIRLLKEAW